jgi:hypothetical protein
MTKVVPYLFIIIFMTGCRNCDHDIKFTDNQNSFLPDYKENETIYFSGDDGSIDSIKISRITDDFHCPVWGTGIPNRNYEINIRYLSPTDTSINEERTDLFLVLENDNDGTSFTSIKYRNFSSPNIAALAPNYGSALNKFPDAKHIWLLNTSSNNKTLEDSDVIQIIWTKKYGLTKYKKVNGLWYSRVID